VTSPGSAFDPYAARYQDEVQKSIAFAGVRHDVFLTAKVDALEDLARGDGRDPRTLDVLDLGCGVGGMTRMLAARFGRVTGTDPSREAVHTAALQGGGAAYTHFDGGRLPFRSGAFDFVVASCVLHHVPRPERAPLVRELLRVCRPPGGLVVFEHNPWHPFTRLAVSRCEFDRDAELLTAGETRSLAEAAQAAALDTRYILLLPWRARIVERLEQALRAVPLGAQYLVFARVAA